MKTLRTLPQALRVTTTWLLAIMVVTVGLAALGCGQTDDSTSTGPQTFTVMEGSLSTEITSSGNLELSLQEDLAFDMAGTVEEVLVSEGDAVEAGQVIARLDTSDWEEQIISLQRSVLQAKINLKNAELTLENAEDDTSTSSTGDIIGSSTDPDQIDILELKVELAEAQLVDAENKLADLQADSPEVVAPFSGFITSVNVDGGDEIMTGTVAAQLADPDRFKVEILVSEMDIHDISVGDSATVTVDSLDDFALPATVTFISPTAIISSSVVNYSITVELASVEEALQQIQAAMQSRQASAAGENQPGNQAASAIADMYESIELKEGLTVAVSITTGQASNAVLVANGAVNFMGQQAYVEVLNDDGTTENRNVNVGISNWQYAEITSGLEVGEVVIVPEGTASQTTGFGTGGSGQMFFSNGGPPR